MKTNFSFKLIVIVSIIALALIIVFSGSLSLNESGNQVAMDKETVSYEIPNDKIEQIMLNPVDRAIYTNQQSWKFLVPDNLFKNNSFSNSSVSFEIEYINQIWTALGLAAIGKWYKPLNENKTEQIRKELQNWANDLSKAVKEGRVPLGFRISLGVHIPTLQYLRKEYPEIKALDTLIIFGGDTLLFNAEKQFDAYFKNENLMILSMVARGLTAFSEIYSSSEMKINPVSGYLYNYQSSDNRKQDLIQRVDLAADKITNYAINKYETQKTDQKKSNIFNEGACWWYSAQYARKKDKNSLDQIFEYLNNNKGSIYLQALAPCLEALKIGCSLEGLDSQTCKDFDSIINSTLARYWDDPNKPLCKGDGSFLRYSEGYTKSNKDCPKSLDGTTHFLSVLSDYSELQKSKSNPAVK